MSLVTWPWRKSLASAPVSASFPRSERSTTKVPVVTHETLALFQAGEPPRDLARELLQHPLPRHPGLQRRARDGRLLRAVEPFEQREETLEVIGDLIGHVRSLTPSCRLPKSFRKFWTRSRRIGPTSSSICASKRTATSTPPRWS